MDDEGLPSFPSGFSFQWVQVDGTTETEVGTDSATYTPVGADIGKKIKVKVTFTDNDGNAEGPLESDATASVTAAPAAPCPSDADWCTTLTVGVVGPSMGNTFLGLIGTVGSLDDNTFELGSTTYTISSLYFKDSAGTSNDIFHVALVTVIPEGTIVSLNGTQFTATSQSGDGFGRYTSNHPTGFDWGDGQKVTVGIKFPAASDNATGKPGIIGVPQVGETLTATIGTIDDDYGVPAFPSAFDFQWVRVNGSTETNIGSDSPTYNPVAGDVGKKIKVKVSFTDDRGGEETLESDETAKVAAAQPACPSDSNWCATLTIGVIGPSMGITFVGLIGAVGSLDDDTFELGSTTYTISSLYFKDSAGTSNDIFHMALDAVMPASAILSVDGTQFTATAQSSDGFGRYTWDHPAGLAWIDGQKVTVGVKFPAVSGNATGKPGIIGVPQVGETLTATIGMIDDDYGVPAFPSGFEFQWVRVDGSTETNIGSDSPTYNPVAGDVGKKIKVKVSFTDDTGGEETLESEETANTAAALGACPSDSV